MPRKGIPQISRQTAHSHLRSIVHRTPDRISRLDPPADRNTIVDDIKFGAVLLASLFRWMHILAAIAAVGGTIFARLALLPSLQELPEGHRKTLHEAIRSRWSKVVMASIGFLLISGVYNLVIISKAMPEDMKPFYHPLFGIKFLLALVIFFIASAMTGRSAAFEKMRTNARFWLTLNMVLAILLVCISGVLRITRDQAAKSSQPESSLSKSVSPESWGPAAPGIELAAK